LAFVSTAGGQVTNATGGLISGQYGIQVYGSGGTVTNNGTITAANEAIIFGGTGANRLVVGQSSAITGDVLGSTATGSTNTLELQTGPGTLNDLAAGDGTMNENSHTWSFENFGTIDVDSGGAWTFAGNNSVATITDNGEIDLTGGSLDVTGSIDPTSKGMFQLNGNNLEVAAALGTSTQVSFFWFRRIEDRQRRVVRHRRGNHVVRGTDPRKLPGRRHNRSQDFRRDKCGA
jgi:hypothetical protein